MRNILVAIALFGLLAPTTLDACSCSGPALHPSCSTAGSAAAVFTGTVLSIALPAMPPAPVEPAGQRGLARLGGDLDPMRRPMQRPLRVVRMHLTEALNGVEPWQNEIEVLTGF